MNNEVIEKSKKTYKTETFKYTLKDDKAEIIGFLNRIYPPNKLVIPNTLDAYSVTSIGDYGFNNNEIETLIIGEKVEFIGKNAFKSQNRKLKRVIILGDEKRFNNQWESIGFPKKLMQSEQSIH